ncbi:uncharacterized protein LOC113511756 [Galleria mellonella]|uniref:Uncharacterized protein LOC113511756 n=1 Tax=Galleria mellonella TaxID=7137 RepID=A0A6J1WDG2_GALME|nr:uncharacterized protein LOC113511756 [Galleria mellonella]
MKEFKYDVIELIRGVRERPCLWNKTLENYKDRVERRTAWEQIFRSLDERYDEMSAEEKRTMGELVLNKWTNIRDTFVKSLKTKMGKPKRKYLLHHHLKFLINESEEAGESMDDTSEPSNSFMKQEEPTSDTVLQRISIRKHNDSDEDYVPDETPSRYTNAHNTRKRSKKTEYKEEDMFTNTKEYATNSALNFVEVEEAQDPRVMNEDEAFFASLLPTVVKYNEDERLEFRIQVLSVMKKIKESGKWQN